MTTAASECSEYSQCSDFSSSPPNSHIYSNI